jgi:hypothetical protein
MQSTPPNLPNEEGPFLPWLETPWHGFPIQGRKLPLVRKIPPSTSGWGVD